MFVLNHISGLTRLAPGVIPLIFAYLHPWAQIGEQHVKLIPTIIFAAILPVSAMAQYYNAAPQLPPVYQPNNPAANLQWLQRSLQPPQAQPPQLPQWQQQQPPVNCFSMANGNMWTTTCR